MCSACKIASGLMVSIHLNSASAVWNKNRCQWISILRKVRQKWLSALTKCVKNGDMSCKMLMSNVYSEDRLLRLV
jgi:hypothetical protein